MFKRGENIAHPVYGVCRIHSVERLDIGGGTQDYYVVYVGTNRNKVRVFLPALRGLEMGLRYPVTKAQARDILDAFQSPPAAGEENLRPALEELSSSFERGDAFRLAEAVRRVAVCGVEGEEAELEGEFATWKRREEALMARSLQRLGGELAAVLEIPYRDVDKRIRKGLRKGRRLQKVS